MVEMTEGTNQNLNEPDGSNANPNPDGSGENKPKLYDEKFVKELQTETIQRRKEIEGLKKQLKEIEDAKLTEAEKKEKELNETKAKLESLENSIKQGNVDNLILKSLTGKNIVDVEAAELLIKKELASEEEITDKVVEKVVDKLIKDKPYLVSTTPVNPSDGNFGKQNNEAGQDANASMVKFLQS
jgi:vacuolar-type H+-ATPase subunit I/STV1